MLCQSTEIDLEVVVSRIKRGDINLQPDFQRGEVWSNQKKQKLIDSILRGWKIPPIHVIFTKGMNDEVLDGQQRLVAIRDFFEDRIRIDGRILPRNPEIEMYDGAFFSQLPPKTKRDLYRYTLTIVRLSDYKPEEPAELFYRLNQPVVLTAAEQRNAYIGNTRDQIKQLVELFESWGANRDTIGFSNSRLAYDEIISKFAYLIETNTLRIKITAGDISKRYREDIPFSDWTIDRVHGSLKKVVDAMRSIYGKYCYQPKLSKATLFSWLIFATTKNIDYEELGDFIYHFEFLRDYLKNKVDSFLNYGEIEKSRYLLDRYNFLDTLMNVFNQRASMGSTDSLSIIYRDIIIN